MFRTRDFILLFSTIMFLVMAIGTTLITQGRTSDSGTLVFDPAPAAEYVAVIASSESLSRNERVAQMRAKISQETFISKPEDTPTEIIVAELGEGQTEEVFVGGIIRCPEYQLYQGFWDARDVSLSELEGAQVLIRGTVSSTSIPEIVLQLPVAFQATGNPACIGSDVIGVANDGSLIRNDEVALYSIFGASTLVGYALDGFPIYGVGTSVVDSCGGRVVAGQYRYELQSGSETLISCFAGTPAVVR
jgi:hypothetical protein